MIEAIIFCIGLFIGSIVGIIVAALCSASGRSETELYIKQILAERDSAIEKIRESEGE